MSATEIEEVRVMERKRAAAMVDADVDAIADLLDDRLIYCHSSGVVDTRESYLSELRKAEYTYHSVELDTIDHQIVERNQVIVNSVMTVSMTVRSSGQTVSRQIRATSIWVRAAESPGWRLLVSHSTNLA
jgi:ketosteroid isomerase-like protein